MEIEIILPDKTKKMFPENITGMEIAKSIHGGLAKKSVAAVLNGKKIDLNMPLKKGGEFSLITLEDEEGLDIFRHSSSHVMAEAVQNLFPDAKFGIGPAIKDGFYYDFDMEHVLVPEDLEKIEKEVEKIIKNKKSFERRVVTKEEALKIFRDKKEDYKVELIEGLPKDAEISLYAQGDFVDLCAGPHIPDTGMIKAFKLMSIAGAYWRGDENNKMLQRIYGTSFPKKAQLKEHLERLEEAKKRDHRKLGAELGLFTMCEEGPGFPFFLPKGMIIRNELENLWREEHRKAGYQEIKTPIMLNRSLWEQSGHWEHYKENMYYTQIDQQDFAIKPMNCPGGMLVYKQGMHSYRELPLRYGELGLVHRHEMSGALHGLMRVRCFTQDDAHIFMLPSQIKTEIANVIELIDGFYNLFGFKYHVELSTKPEKSMGAAEDWEKATQALKEALKAKNVDYLINEGDGAFYGPKIDFHLEDCLGRTWQCGTIQLDFQMPEKFDLNYIGEDGGKHRPVMIHRVVFGSIERFIGILTEHFAGAFPLWLAPTQVKLLPITENQHAYAQDLAEELKKAGVRVENDERNEKIGFKIREARNERVPYILVVGERESAEGQVAVRQRGKGDLGAMDFAAIKNQILQEIVDKSI